MLQRMKELIPIINEADIAYYKYDAPIMTDREYDLLYNELLELEKLTGIVLSNSPTQKVSGETLESLVQVRHTRPMLSAEKTKSIDTIADFVGEKAVIVSWKLDGLTLVLRYGNGKLMQAITRGTEGMVGEDVTHTAKAFMNVPLEIPCKDSLDVRGEGVISWKNFNKINQEIEVPYTHPRNLAAGAVRRLDAEKSRGQYLEFFAFELINDNSDYNSKHSQLTILAENGFDVVPHVYIKEQAGRDQIDCIIKGFDPGHFDYPVDGLIVEYDDLAYGRSLGETGHHTNRLIGLKWEDKLYDTVFLGLELATTRTGMVSLTGIFADTEIDGTVVNRAYLHNLDIFDKFNLGTGDRVKIYKANMIIPQLAENITRSGTLQYPVECPCCGSRLQIRSSDSGTRLLFCDEPTCPAKLIRKFVHFCSKTRMNIPGISEKTLEKFINNGWVKNFGDLYELEQHREAFVNMPGFGEKLFDKIQKAISNSRNCTLNQLIAGLGIPMVGRAAGRILDSYFNGDWDAFENAILSGFDFTQIQDFGRTLHDNIYSWYADESEAKLWRPLLIHINIIGETGKTSTNANNVFFGKTVVATGKLINYTRDGIQEKLLSLGAKPGSSISKNTDYLIVGENAGSKLDRAHSLGVTTLTESEFEAMLNPAEYEKVVYFNEAY
jgi:DNA ligase (NAD+)